MACRRRKACPMPCGRGQAGARAAAERGRQADVLAAFGQNCGQARGVRSRGGRRRRHRRRRRVGGRLGASYRQIDAAEVRLGSSARRGQIDRTACVVIAVTEIDRTEAASTTAAATATEAAGRTGRAVGDGGQVYAAATERVGSRGLRRVGHDGQIDLSSLATRPDVEIDLSEAATRGLLRRSRSSATLRDRQIHTGPVRSGRRRRRLRRPRRGSRRPRRHGRCLRRSGRRARWCRRSRTFFTGAGDEQTGAALGAPHLQTRRRNAPFVDLIRRVAAVALDLDHRAPVKGFQMYHASPPPRPKVW